MPGSLGPEVLGLKSSQGDQGPIGLTKVSSGLQDPCGASALECLLRGQALGGWQQEDIYFIPPRRRNSQGMLPAREASTLQH